MNIPSEAAKQESSTSTTSTNAKPSNPSSSSTSSRSRSRDPRIVRVSRAFGGKDRHSKVCTVRGLRDRRVRLSVPTAIQLYDLQDRLGLNQPSKVVDWLLNAAKNEIDELPPLQIPPNFGFMVSQQDKQGINMFLGKSKDVSGETSGRRDENWARNDEQERRLAHQEPYVSANNINFDISRQNPSSLMTCNNNIGLYNSFGRWDPSNLSLSHHPPGRSTAHPNEDLHNFGLVPLPPMLSGSPSAAAAHQVLVYQPEVSTQPYFPIEFEPKQSSFQISPHLPAVRPFHFSMSTANLLPSQDNAVDDQHNKHNDFHLGQP